MNEHFRWMNKSGYRQVSNIRRTLVGNWIVDHSDVVGASPVGAAPTTFSLSTKHLASLDWAKTIARRYEYNLSLGIWCVLYYRFYGNSIWSRKATPQRFLTPQPSCLQMVMRRSRENLHIFGIQSDIMRAISSLLSPMLSFYKAGSRTSWESWARVHGGIVNSFPYMLLSVLTRATQNIFNRGKMLGISIFIEFFSYILSIIGLLFSYNYTKIRLVLSLRGMPGAVMFNQTHTPFDVLGNWPGVE